MLSAALVGRTTPERVSEVEKHQIRFFAKAIGEKNSIHFDEEAAKKAGYRSIVAPPTFVFCLCSMSWDELGFLRQLGVDVDHMLHAEQSITHHDVICAGDRL